MEEAIAELLRNGVEAPRPRGRAPRIELNSRIEGRTLLLRISDNGTGLPEVLDGTPLNEINLATKARPSGGLIHVAEIMALTKGSAYIATNSAEGTTIEMSFPIGPTD